MTNEEQLIRRLRSILLTDCYSTNESEHSWRTPVEYFSLNPACLRITYQTPNSTIDKHEPNPIIDLTLNGKANLIIDMVSCRKKLQIEIASDELTELVIKKIDTVAKQEYDSNCLKALDFLTFP